MSDVFGPTALVTGQTLSGFASFLPRLSDVRKASSTDSDMVGDVRLGEIAATSVAIGLGVISSALTRSPIPMYAAAFVAIMLIIVYEAALRGNDLFSPTKGDTSHA